MTKAEQARIVAWRLRILQHAASEPHGVARTCRYFGISRTAFYRWKKRDGPLVRELDEVGKLIEAEKSDLYDVLGYRVQHGAGYPRRACGLASGCDFPGP